MKPSPIKQISDPNFPTREEIKKAMISKLGRVAPLFVEVIEPCAEAVERMLLKKWRNDKRQQDL